jgi:L-rhamnose mutarotase
MKRYGSIIGLRDENIAEYRKLHAAVWSVVAGAMASFTRAAPSAQIPNSCKYQFS